MISYHLNQSMNAAHYASGFKSAYVMEMERIAKCITTYAWSPCWWKEGRRSQANFISAKFCVLDFDDGEMSLDEAKRIFCDCIHLIGTTRSHQKEKNGQICDRFRVLFVFEKPVNDLRLYRWNMHRFMRHYPCDKACKDGARFFYPCQEIVSLAQEGYVQDVDFAIPEDFERPRPIDRAMLANKSIPNDIINEFNRKYKMLNRHSAIFRFACLLAPFDFKPLEILQRIKDTSVFKRYPEKVDSDEEILRTINDALTKCRMEESK